MAKTPLYGQGSEFHGSFHWCTFPFQTWRSGVVVPLFHLRVMSLAAQAADSDGDGVQDSADDCPWAAGTSTVDKDGCPDWDGDGTSDFSDAWAIGNPNYQNEFTTSSNSDYYGVDYSPDGEFIVTGSEDDFVRIWNASTWTNVRSVNAGADVNGVDFSLTVCTSLRPSTTIRSTSTTAAIFRLCMEASALMLAAATRSMPWNSSRTVLLLPWRLDAQATAAPTAKSPSSTCRPAANSYAVNPNGEDRFYDIAHFARRPIFGLGR